MPFVQQKIINQRVVLEIMKQSLSLSKKKNLKGPNEFILFLSNEFLYSEKSEVIEF